MVAAVECVMNSVVPFDVAYDYKDLPLAVVECYFDVGPLVTVHHLVEYGAVGAFVVQLMIATHAVVAKFAKYFV